jgi:hydrogenase/urease accessory protein HupE
MQTATVKGSLQLFGVIAVGTALFGLWQGYGIGETLTAAVILSAFVVGIAWAGARAERRFNCK